MTARQLNVRRLLRARGAEEEALELRPGVNVLVGGPNTGKTQWLRTLDYLLGDTGGVEDALGSELAEKYDRAQVELTVDGRPLRLERRWKERGARHKLFVDGRPVASADFSAFFLEVLGIPRVRVPRGNPHAPQAWPELSWRMMLRHLYRAEAAWGELAPKQPESEQHAVLLQFLGAARSVFSPAQAQLVEAQRREAQLEAQAASFTEVLADVTRELLPGGVPARAALEAALSAVEAELAELGARREERVAALRSGAAAEAARAAGGDAEELERLGRELEEARARQLALTDALEHGERRAEALARRLDAAVRLPTGEDVEAPPLAEATALPDSVHPDRADPDRADPGGAAPADEGSLQEGSAAWDHVVHCPACERTVAREAVPPDTCALCLQPHADRVHEGGGPAHASVLPPALTPAEVAGLEAELGRVRTDVDAARAALLAANEEVARLEERLAPVREAAAWLLPEGFGAAEQEVGRLQERLRQLRRVEPAVARCEALDAQLAATRAEVARLAAAAAQAQVEPELPALGEQVADAMRGYLNALDARDRERWAARGVSVSVARNASQLLVDRKPWGRKLGANLRAYLFLAYHYAWLRLSRSQPFLSPGLVVLDFPANLGDFGVSNQERYLLVPFVGLLSRPDMQGAQLIAAGRAFASLPGAHRVDLTRRWR